MKLKTQEPFGHSRNIVRVVNEHNRVVGEIHKRRNGWGTPTTYQFYPDPNSGLVGAYGTKIVDILRKAEGAA